MPDLNLIEEEGEQGTEGSGDSLDNLEESEGEGRGGNKVIKIVVIVVGVAVLGGGGYFLLKSLGVIGGKKPVTVVQEIPEQYPAQEAESQEAAPSGQVDLVETPALDAKGKAWAKTEKQGAKAVGTTSTGTAPGKKVSDMTGEYTIQVSAFRDQAQAEVIQKRLEEAGYPAFVEARDHKDGSWYTVRIGRYSSRKDAEKAVGDFALELRSNYWVDRIRSH